MTTTYDAGKYQAEIVNHGFAEAKTGTPYLFVQVRLLGRYNAQGKQHACPSFERSIHLYMSKNEVCTRILLDCLLLLGVDQKDLGRLDLDSADSLSLVGRRVDVECDHEAYQGRTRERWRLARERKKLSSDRLREIVGRIAGGDTPSAEAVPQLPPAPPPDAASIA